MGLPGHKAIVPCFDEVQDFDISIASTLEILQFWTLLLIHPKNASLTMTYHSITSLLPDGPEPCRLYGRCGSVACLVSCLTLAMTGSVCTVLPQQTRPQTRCGGGPTLCLPLNRWELPGSVIISRVASVHSLIQKVWGTFTELPPQVATFLCVRILLTARTVYVSVTMVTLPTPCLMLQGDIQLIRGLLTLTAATTAQGHVKGHTLAATWALTGRARITHCKVCHKVWVKTTG